MGTWSIREEGQLDADLLSRDLLNVVGADDAGVLVSRTKLLSGRSFLQGYDVIGDVHGCATQLLELLDAMGYRKDKVTGAYCHANRQAVFVGDLIDRGTATAARHSRRRESDG